MPERSDRIHQRNKASEARRRNGEGGTRRFTGDDERDGHVEKAGDA